MLLSTLQRVIEVNIKQCLNRNRIVCFFFIIRRIRSSTVKEIIVSIFTILLTGFIARIVLPKFETFVQWLIVKLVNYAEKKVQGSNLGRIKKDKVLRWLKWFGVHADSAVSSFIDATVEAMNNKGIDVKSEVQSNVLDKATSGLENTSEKVVDKILNK